MDLKLKKFSLYRFMKRNLSDPLTYKNNLFNLFKYWIRGFDTKHILLYDLNKDNYQFYPKDISRYKVSTNTNKQVWPILHDKLLFDSFMKDKLPITQIIFFITEGKINSDKYFSDLIERIKDGDKFVIKPLRSGRGEGIYFISREEEDILVNNEKLSVDDFSKLLESLNYHGVYNYVDQHEQLKNIFPFTTNTLRVTIYQDKEGANLFGGLLRIGTTESMPLDSTSKGAIACIINESTGRTYSAFKKDSQGRRINIDKHPNSEEEILDIKIPYWNKIRRDLLRFHEAYPSFDLVGWDILVGSNGYHVIEANHNPDLRSTLCYQNFDDDNRFFSFFKNKNIL